MKKGLVIILSTFLVINLQAQNRKRSDATVNKVYNIPVYLYSEPVEEFEEVGEVTATFSAIEDALSDDGQVSVADKVKEIVKTAKNKLKKGKVKEFNAIIINPDDYTGMLIKIAKKEDLTATVKLILGVPVYMFSYPNKDYTEIKDLTATMSMLLGDSKLSDNVKELIEKAKKKEKKGKIDKFDAIIINPDDFTGTLIKFNS